MVRFVTASGRAVPAVDAAGMREVDRVAVEEVGLELLQMMENAGRTLAASARELASGGRVVVLAGSGGNGGGGLCAARHLANHGDEVRVVLDRAPDALTGAAAAQCRVLAATAAAVDHEGPVDDALAGADAVVDALVGYGLEGVLEGRAAYLVSAANRADARTLALDVPSGVDASTGERAGPAVAADRTVTLALPKTGLADVGDLRLADVGIPEEVYERAGVAYDQPFDGRSTVRLSVRPDDEGDPDDGTGSPARGERDGDGDGGGGRGDREDA
jgi:NAD(P)H-hydrate epimerase